MRNCTLIEFSTGLKNGSNSECSCLNKFRWKANYEMCILSCEDIEYTEKGWSNPGDDFCACITGFIWESNTTQCEFNCSSVENATGLTNGSIDHCDCISGNEWNGDLMTCVSKSFDVLMTTIVGTGVVCKYLFYSQRSADWRTWCTWWSRRSCRCWPSWRRSLRSRLLLSCDRLIICLTIKCNIIIFIVLENAVTNWRVSHLCQFPIYESYSLIQLLYMY